MGLRHLLAAGLVALTTASPADAQLLGRGAGPLALGGPLALPRLGEIARGVTADLSPDALVEAHTARLEALVRNHPRTLERDEHGNAVLRHAVLALSPSPQVLAAALQEGFTLLSREPLLEGELDGVVLAPPAGRDARWGLRRLRELDPRGVYDYDSLFEPSGLLQAGAETGTGRSGEPAASRSRTDGESVVLGLVDTGVDLAAPVFRNARVQTAGFGPGGLTPAAHGTEVASLIVGAAPGFHGSDPGARLLAADVYGRSETGGAADMVLRALAWTVRGGARVVNISLVGPENALVRALTEAAVRRGVLIVAPVGNDGPAAPPVYPASYPGVIAVTGVDARGRPLIEAGHALHLDFAAPGADLAAAAPGGGFAAVRGTSFAAPLVSGLLALAYERSPDDPSAALRTLALQARPGPGLGRGLVGMELRTPPGAVRP